MNPALADAIRALLGEAAHGRTSRADARSALADLLAPYPAPVVLATVKAVWGHRSVKALYRALAELIECHVGRAG